MPEDLLTRAFEVTRQQLDAIDTKFTTFHGKFTDKREVPDNVARLKAAEQVYKLADIFRDEPADGAGGFGMELEVDMESGIMRFKVGGGARRNTDLDISEIPINRLAGAEAPVALSDNDGPIPGDITAVLSPRLIRKSFKDMEAELLEIPGKRDLPPPKFYEAHPGEDFKVVHDEIVDG